MPDTPTHPTPAPHSHPHPNRGVLARAHRFLIYLGALYVALVVLVTFPPVQRQVVYMHALKFPFFTDFAVPEKYGLAPFQTANVYIPTADNETLGAWFTLADTFYAARAPTAPPDDATLRAALAAHPTVLFFHGNAATRAFHRRVQHYTTYASRLGANVLALDYRGFGDSSGAPSEAGLALDARAAWDWLVRRGGARAGDVLVVGNSLGTAVAAGLVRELELELELEGAGAQGSRGLVLLAPFASVEALMDTYAVFGLVPLLAPLKTLPYVPVLFKRLLRHRFDTLSKVAGLRTPVLLVHAQDDWDIPHAHSAALFAAMLEPHLPALPLDAAATAATAANAAVYRARADARAALVTRTEVPRLGVMEAFVHGGSDVVFLETRWGGHDTVGLLGGVQEVMRARYDMR